jgi:hypothetical protein
MVEDTVANHDAELAMLVGMTGATIKQASLLALDESGGDHVDAATTYLNKGVPHNLEKAAMISKKMQSTSMKASHHHRREFEDSAAKPSIDPRSTSPNPEAARAHQESLSSLVDVRI